MSGTDIGILIGFNITWLMMIAMFNALIGAIRREKDKP